MVNFIDGEEIIGAYGLVRLEDSMGRRKHFIDLGFITNKCDDDLIRESALRDAG